MKELKLTKTQLDVYNQILEDLKRNRQYKTAEEFYKANRPEWAKWEDENEFIKNLYINDFNEIKENITLARANSSTLRVLERKGLIQILEDGKKYIDKVKVLKEM